MQKTYGELNPSSRVLLGPGPSNVHPRVLDALSKPLLGHMDPEFLEILNEVNELLQFVFQTKNKLTIAVSATGSAGMEACFVNSVEHGDNVLVCVNGVFGKRMCDVAERCGANVTRVEAEWGRSIDAEDVRRALKKGKFKLVAIVHAETSTGVRQPIEEISRLAHDNGALLLMDAVTSLGGIAVKLDEWEVDLCYSGTQKCLSCPPGLSPISFSPRAMDAIHKRKAKVQSWYLDMTMVEQYWGKDRVYHHTAPVSMIYALRESLRIIQEEGLRQRFERHYVNHHALETGLKTLGIDFFAEDGRRLPMLNAVTIPKGIDDLKIRRRLLSKYGIEIGGGLGPNKGQIWRIGLMGHSSRKENVILVLNALEEALNMEGAKFPEGSAAQAAEGVFSNV